jgi:hypothetical protein
MATEEVATSLLSSDNLLYGVLIAVLAIFVLTRVLGGSSDKKPANNGDKSKPVTFKDKKEQSVKGK